MKVIRVIQPHDFGDDFEFSEGKWKVRFPLKKEPKYNLSSDENNAIVLDLTEAIHLDKTKLYAYIMVQDDQQAKVFLYRYPAGTEFDRATATEVGAADMVEINALIDDIAITDATVEFIDVHSGKELVFDTNQFQRTGELYAERGLTLESIQGEESTVNKLQAQVPELIDNIIQTREQGLYIDPSDLDGEPTIPQSLEAIEIMDAPVNEGKVYDSMLYRIGDDYPALEIPLVTLVNNRGVVLGSIVKTIVGRIGNEPR